MKLAKLSPIVSIDRVDHVRQVVTLRCGHKVCPPFVAVVGAFTRCYECWSLTLAQKRIMAALDESGGTARLYAGIYHRASLYILHDRYRLITLCPLDDGWQVSRLTNLLCARAQAQGEELRDLREIMGKTSAWLHNVKMYPVYARLTNLQEEAFRALCYSRSPFAPPLKE